MKKMKTFRNLLMVAFLLATFSLSAQLWVATGPHIRTTNTGFASIGTQGATPLYTLDVNQLATEPTIAIRNTGLNGGAAFRMIDVTSGADWKFKAIQTGGFKIRDVAYGLDVMTFEKNSATHAIYVGGNGIVGFGTNAPTDLHGFGGKIDVRGDIQMSDANAFLQIDNTLTNSNCGIVLSEVGAYTSWIWYDGSANYLTINADPGGGFRKDIIVHSTGEVGIGTSTTKTGYRLSVDGKVACEEVLVENSTNWPDYVFDEDYELTSLEQLEESIEENNHLPGLPSAAEVEENGFSLGEMQKIFLEKLEELTLYTIEQGKQIKEQQERIEALEQENKKLKK